MPVVTLRSHRRVPPCDLAPLRPPASSSDSPDMGVAKAGEADATIVPPTDTGHAELQHPVVRRGTTERSRRAGSPSKLATQAWTTQAKRQSSSLLHRKLCKHITGSGVN